MVSRSLSCGPVWVSSRWAATVALTQTLSLTSWLPVSVPGTMYRMFVVSTCLIAKVALSVHRTAS